MIRKPRYLSEFEIRYINVYLKYRSFRGWGDFQKYSYQNEVASSYYKNKIFPFKWGHKNAFFRSSFYTLFLFSFMFFVYLLIFLIIFGEINIDMHAIFPIFMSLSMISLIIYFIFHRNDFLVVGPEGIIGRYMFRKFTLKWSDIVNIGCKLRTWNRISLFGGGYEDSKSIKFEIEQFSSTEKIKLNSIYYRSSEFSRSKFNYFTQKSIADLIFSYWNKFHGKVPFTNVFFQKER